MLCEASAIFGESLTGIWMVMTAMMLLLITISSGPVFYYYYWRSSVTYDKWRYKASSNLKEN
jgi:hypothetical protein